MGAPMVTAADMTLAVLCGTGALLFGATLGLRFNIFALVPATVLSVVAALSIVASQGHEGWMLAFAAGLTVIGVQAGYLGAVMTTDVGDMAQGRLAPALGVGAPGTVLSFPQPQTLARKSRLSA